MAFSVARFTTACSTCGTPSRASPTWYTQAAHVIPLTGIVMDVTFCLSTIPLLTILETTGQSIEIIRLIKKADI